MEKSKQAGATPLETRNLLENDLAADRDVELRPLTDVELTLAGGGDNVVIWG
jgi:hypothetical protein